MAVVDFRGERFLSPPECFWNLREQKHCWHDDAVLGTVGLVDGGVDQVAAGAQHEVSRPFVLPVTDAIADADRPHARFRCPRLQFLRSFRHAALPMDTLHEAWRVDAGPDGDGLGRNADRPVYVEEHPGGVDARILAKPPPERRLRHAAFGEEVEDLRCEISHGCLAGRLWVFVPCRSQLPMDAPSTLVPTFRRGAVRVGRTAGTAPHQPSLRPDRVPPQGSYCRATVRCGRLLRSNRVRWCQIMKREGLL